MPKIDPIARGERVTTLGEGSFGRVDLYKLPDGKRYAVKIAELEKPEMLSSSSLRETVTTKLLQGHPNIIKLYETGFIKGTHNAEDYMVLELASMDLREYLSITASTITSTAQKSLIYQLCCAVDFCLSNDVLHRDLKPQNIMVFLTDATGSLGNGALPTIKLADFGMARTLGCVQGTGMTKEVVTTWYRAPELLLGGKYGHSLDKWSVGCIVYEILTNKPLFPGDSDLDVLFRIFRRFGNPGTEFDSLPEWQSSLMLDWAFNPSKLDDIETAHGKTITDLILPLFSYVPEARPSLRSIYQNPYFDDVRNSPRGIEDYPEAGCLDNIVKRSVLLNEMRAAIKNKHDIGIYQIAILIVWLTEVAHEYKLAPRTYFYAIDLLFTILPKIDQIIKDNLQLYGITCIYVSCLINEIMIPELSDFSYITDNSSTEKEIAIASRQIVEAMDYNLIRSTCTDYYMIYQSFYPLTPRDITIGIAALQILSSSRPEIYTKYIPRTLALCVLLLQTTYKEIPFKHSQYLSDIMECYDRILQGLTLNNDLKSELGTEMKEIVAMIEKAKTVPIQV